MLLKIRATVPILVAVAYFIVRIPTQANAHPAEIISAFILVPTLLAWGVTGLERVIREAQSTVDTALAECLDEGPATEPMLLTHEFQPVSEEATYRRGDLYQRALADWAEREAYPRLGGRHERTEIMPAVTE